MNSTEKVVMFIKELERCSQDLYPTYLRDSKESSEPNTTAATTWGIMLIQLAEMSSTVLCTTFPGVAHQISSTTTFASTQIKATQGKYQKTTATHMGGVMENFPDYAKVQGILIRCTSWTQDSASINEQASVQKKELSLLNLHCLSWFEKPWDLGPRIYTLTSHKRVHVLTGCEKQTA
ncbi:hypothetical protein ARMGADRAFT_1039861 [Armillaria gallica]|uniref:Uncharacterized protein n=1 Tax=Armillaria gallica TaxID=47427 RepID=A0A2H3CVC2_ARMGA|nr:hypothetical protein ARMGADRAFT_1039861 [Armillaria gallica]